ncbi:hypothetical protein ABPG74_014109 [Tetrahymena malaccensis]
MNPNPNYPQYPPQPYCNLPQNYIQNPFPNFASNTLSGTTGTTNDPKCNNDHPNYTKDRLPQGKRLDQDKWLVSQNQKFQAGIQEDGNLIVMSFSDNPHKLQLQSNGNLELQDYRNAKLWESDTLNQGQGPYILIMQNNGNKLEQDKWLVSQSQKYYAGVQADGNLVISTNQNSSPYCCIWSSKTKKKGDGSNCLSLEGSGILKVQDKRNAILWDSDTLNQGQGPYTLIMQNDGNLALFDRNESIIWCSNTSYQQ